MNLKSLTDDELSELGNSVLLEQNRRSVLSSIPGQVAALSITFQAEGGDVVTLRDAVG